MIETIKSRMWISATVNDALGVMVSDDTEWMLHYERVEKWRFKRMQSEYDEVVGKTLIMYICLDAPYEVSVEKFASWYWRMKQDGRFSKYRLD